MYYLRPSTAGGFFYGVNMGNDLRVGIIDAAQALGMAPVDLATIISYETGGTFSPTQAGPRTQWGRHRGLIQFGEPQAVKYGVDWDNPLSSQLGADGAVVKYMRDAGFKPGMGMLDAYSAVNAGRVGRYNASDANNGGAPGTVADKVNNQMAGHRKKAMALLGDMAGSSAHSALADGPKGRESYPPQPARQTAIASNAVPASVKNSAQLKTGGVPDILGSMALMEPPTVQFGDSRVMGPSPEQANALSQLVNSLRNRMA